MPENHISGIHLRHAHHTFFQSKMRMASRIRPRTNEAFSYGVNTRKIRIRDICSVGSVKNILRERVQLSHTVFPTSTIERVPRRVSHEAEEWAQDVVRVPKDDVREHLQSALARGRFAECEPPLERAKYRGLRKT